MLFQASACVTVAKFLLAKAHCRGGRIYKDTVQRVWLKGRWRIGDVIESTTYHELVQNLLANYFLPPPLPQPRLPTPPHLQVGFCCFLRTSLIKSWKVALNCIYIRVLEASGRENFKMEAMVNSAKWCIDIKRYKDWERPIGFMSKWVTRHLSKNGF